MIRPSLARFRDIDQANISIAKLTYDLEERCARNEPARRYRLNGTFIEPVSNHLIELVDARHRRVMCKRPNADYVKLHTSRNVYTTRSFGAAFKLYTTLQILLLRDVRLVCKP